jgi:hypothetical protein
MAIGRRLNSGTKRARYQTSPPNIQDDLIQEGGERVCNYKKGDTVIYKGEKYKLIDRYFNGEIMRECISVDLEKISTNEIIGKVPIGEISKNLAPAAPAPPDALAPAPIKVKLPKKNTVIKDNLLEDSEEEDIATFEEQKQDTLIQLRSKIDTCKSECKKLEDEYKILHDLEEHKIFSDFSLPIDATLFNLLTQRILDPSPDWKNKIDILINIPTSLKFEGGNINRGGDYMEALSYIGILPE